MKAETGLAGCFAGEIAQILASFSERDPAGKQSLQQLLISDRDAFSRAGILVLAGAPKSPGTRYLVHLLAKEKLLAAPLVDLSACTDQQAFEAARSMVDNGAPLQAALEWTLNQALHAPTCPETTQRILRCLAILDTVGAQSCWNLFEIDLMAYPDSHVRSKAAFLIASNTKNGVWVGRRLVDRDPRVQANAIEALWNFDAAESRPLLITASRSQNNRVAGNAAVGLYRISDLNSIRMIVNMARHDQLLFRLTGIWAMGETGDPRFIPFLSEQFRHSDGKERLAITRALARLRRRVKILENGSRIDLRVSEAKLEADGSRRIVFTASPLPASGPGNLRPTDFAVWEGASLVYDYNVTLPENPALLAIGFVLPRFVSAVDPYGCAAADALHRCLRLKRPADLWRLDRYTIDAATEIRSLADNSILPYEDALITNEVKLHHGFMAAPESLASAIDSTIPRERASRDCASALERQYEAINKHAAKRHVFVFLHSGGQIENLGRITQNQRVVLHGVSVSGRDANDEFRRLCLSTPEGTFIGTDVENLAQSLEIAYTNLLNRFEIAYRPEPAGVEPGPATLTMATDAASGRAEFNLA